MTIEQILKICKVKSPDVVTVQLNRKFIRKENYATIFPNEKDEIIKDLAKRFIVFSKIGPKFKNVFFSNEKQSDNPDSANCQFPGMLYAEQN